MTAVPIVVETQDLVVAARMLRLWSVDPLCAATNALSATLGDCGAMAGSDPGGLAWAESYDRAAAAALQTTADVINGVDSLAALLGQTAHNYATAEIASTADRRIVEASLDALPPAPRSYFLPICTPPAAGGSAPPPTGWGLVEHVVGYVWPNGHQDRLRRAAAAWRRSATALHEAADDARSACRLAAADGLPEADEMRTVCAATADRLHRVGELHAALGDACDELARHIDEMHAAVENELTSLIEWTAGIEFVGGLLSVVTFGIAEAPTQAGEAARIASTAARIGQLIERFIALARTAGQTVATVAERADRISAELLGLNGARLTTAVVTQVKLTPAALRIQEVIATRRLGTLAGDLPPLKITLSMLERKFKHAAAFGVTERRGRAGFDAYQAAVERFLARPDTKRVIGEYRRRQVILSYNRETRLVVVQDLDGSFVASWRMWRMQTLHVVRDRSLGGG